MAKVKLRTSKGDTAFGRELLAAAKEALAHSRGKIALPTRVVEPLPAKRVKEIRRKVARTTRQFENVTGVPARTVEGWEQGRNLDAPARALLRIIDKEPEAAKRALAAMD
jgi:putative transcriptional regulator